MFSAIGKAFSYMWSDGDSVPDSPTAVSKQNNSNQEKSITPRDGRHLAKKEKNIDGKVTHIFTNHGLINGEIYFSFDDVIGGERPSIGSRVSVTASQDYEGGGWHAVSVTMVNLMWGEEEGDQDQNFTAGEINDLTDIPTDIVGIITHKDDFDGYINDNIIFHCDEGCSFIPCKGDWVQADLRLSDVDNITQEAFNLQPLRVRELDGVISAFKGDHGYIDGEVFFNSETLKNSCVPRRWDPVHYKAIESVQGNCSWRAIEIVKSATNPTR